MHEHNVGNMTREELLEVIKWQDKALNQMLLTIRKLSKVEHEANPKHR
jgi:hypothetical protein